VKLLKHYIWLLIIPVMMTCHLPETQFARKAEQEQIAKRREYYAGLIAAYETQFQKSFSEAGCPGAAMAIVVDSTLVWSKCYGQRSVERNLPVEEHTLFRLGSLSKGISSVLVSKLVHQGKLSWTDHVKNYLSSFTMADTSQAGRISISHLLSHSTGLPRHTFTDLIESGLNASSVLDRLQKVRLIGKEGQSFAYQNFAFSLVEDIVQLKTSQKFADLLFAELFAPLGMQDACTDYQTYMKGDNYAAPHRTLANGNFVEMPLNEKYYNAVSAGGINASISDMSLWLQGLMGQSKGVITDEMLHDVFTPVVNSGNESRFRAWNGLVNSYYGMGWRIMEMPDRKIMYHGGSVNDFRTEIAIDPVSGVGVCFLFNGHNNLASHAVPDFLEYWQKAIKSTRDSL
jgi:beta-lactamase class C